MKAIASALTLLVLLPVSMYLSYQILVRVSATDLMWVLFWAQLPLLAIAGLINAMAD